MKLKFFLFSILSMLVGTVGSHAAELSAPKSERSFSYVVRPVVGRLIPNYDNNGEYQDVLISGIAVGVQLGAERTHELTLEYDFAHWTSGVYTLHAEQSIEPILLNYRFRTGTKNSRVRLFFGPSVGYARAHYEVFFAGTYLMQPSDDWVPVYAGSAGVELALCRFASLQLGYRIQYVEGAQFGSGSNYKFRAGTGDVVFGSLSIRF